LGRLGVARIYTGKVKDGSGSERLRGLGASLDVFFQRPLFGVGPGAAGAYFKRHMGDHSFNKYLKEKFSEQEIEKRKSSGRGGATDLKDDCLSYSVWAEVLSEWGFMGFSIFLGALFLMLKRIRNGFIRTATCTIIGIDFFLGQTLPRYDLWFLISFIVTFSLDKTEDFDVLEPDPKFLKNKPT
jgi:O-antigen ligase